MAHKGNQYAAGDLHNQGYVTEKLYMVLQLWCNNKGNPSIELLNLLSELKESIPSSAYLQSMASKITLDSQGRLVLRDNGKIILPYEHFANAVILKHMSGPHGLHLSVDATLRSVMESYTIGKENFGMEREFIVEVVNSCPSTSCRYYKQSPLSFDQQQQQQQQQHQQFASPMNMNSDYLSHMQPPPPTVQSNNNSSSSSMSDSGILSPTQNNIPKLSKSNHQQQQINHQLIQQQNRAMAQQSIENFGSLTALEKQRVMQQLDKKHFETVAAIVQANNNLGLVNQPLAATTNVPQAPQAPHHPQITSIHHPTEVHKAMESRSSSYEGNESYSAGSYATSNKDLLALHNSWSAPTTPIGDQRDVVGQDKIIRAFSELMRNMARMKTFIRPSMVKPYGKQSESLQKTLMDTIQLVQSLRNCLPPPHISVGNWKSNIDPVETVNLIQ